ncbi:sensor histidine kinase [Nonomuraea salmonea]|uniref:histidine kinase n=1 Tax=Nonomuraea salmonea TaxID=46181 RepID=A0ABV5NQN5_9ACTN
MRFVLLGAAVAGLSWFAGAGQAGVPSGLPVPVLVLIAAVAGVAAWHARRAWWPLAAVGALAYVWLLMWPPLLIASYQAGRTLRGARHLVAYVAGCLVVCALPLAVGGPQQTPATGPGNALLMAVAVVGLPLALGMWTRARAEVLAAAKERAERLEREQVMRAEQARAQERARIAREMHDVVAHRVSLIVLHAGALELRTGDPEAAETAALIGGIGREALANLRDVLGVLRAPRHEPTDAALSPPPTLGDLDRLLDQSRALGIDVTRRDEGEPRPMEETVERTAYRVIQEALTNVHKHAGDAGTDVLIRYGEDELRVEVRNAAPPAPHAGEAVPGAGWGLVGLRERVELLGGTLRSSAQDGGGFLVSARIPT